MFGKRLLAIAASLLLWSGHQLVAERVSVAARHYQDRVGALLTPGLDQALRVYLSNNLGMSNQLIQMKDLDPNAPQLLKDWVEKRIAWSQGDGIAGTLVAKQEYDTYNEYIAPFLQDTYFNIVQLQDQLLERKYFQSEITTSSNFLEAFLNGALPFTRSTTFQSPEKQPFLGISPWEAIARFEPVVVDWNFDQLGFLGLLGMNYVCFPDVVEAMVLRENFFSEYVRKLGLRIGTGARWVEGHPQWILGAGIQISAVAVWGLYQPEARSFAIGIGISDFKGVRNFLPFFED